MPQDADTQDTGYYGSHDVTPAERESWEAEVEWEAGRFERAADAREYDQRTEPRLGFFDGDRV